MSANDVAALEKRLQALEDQIAIYQTVCAYGYGVDGLNYQVVADIYAKDGVYAVADVSTFKGNDQIAEITKMQGHLDLVHNGIAHTSTLPYVVIDGDRATATCHTVILHHGKNGFYVNRVSASRLELSRKKGGGWEINHRQNYMLTGDPKGPAMLARLTEPPQARNAAE
jgi:ketosteroid isomerase-like protein